MGSTGLWNGNLFSFYPMPAPLSTLWVGLQINSHLDYWLLSTWETNNAAQSPNKSESVPLENSIELLSRPIYKSGWPTSRRFEYVFYLDSSRLSRWICHIAILIIRGPTEPFTIWIKIILAIFLAKTRPDKTIFSALITWPLILTVQKNYWKCKCRIRSVYSVLFTFLRI